MRQDSGRQNGQARSKLVFPLDYPTLDEARSGARLVSQEVGVLKVGLELFLREGPAAVALCHELGCAVFLDLKLMDIPETVARAVASASELGVDYLTLHASGGRRMLEAARERAERENSRLKLLAVTLLTSLDDSELPELGVAGSAASQVQRLAALAAASGVSGIVCSALELGMLRPTLDATTFFVTPGIRPEGSALGDQKRVATPRQAIEAGADLLVVGRPIRDSPDPAATARAIVAEIASASSQ